MKISSRPISARRPNLLGALAAWLWLAVVLLPIYYIVISTFRDNQDRFIEHPLALPKNPTLRGYRTVLDNDFGMYFLNSVIVTAAVVAIVLVICVMAAYVIVRRTHWLVSTTFNLFLFGIAIPVQAVIVPVFYMIMKLNLYDTYWALILPSVAFAIPLTILILVNFMRDIPKELFESMRVDGASDLQILRRLVVPMSIPAIMTVGIYDALQTWNGFLFPLILTQSASLRTLPLSLFKYQGEFSSDVTAILTAVVLSVVPVFAAYIVGRRQMVAGLTAGFGK